ncbi:uncharacterized protein DS421_11g340990 [Arachis hypogaea]|nr:uncharacterized protein DS421_11g340990 [Arachis hypogaea]
MSIVFPPSIAPCQNGCVAACVPLRCQIAVKRVTAAYFSNQVVVNGAAAVLVPDQSAVNGGGGAISVALVLNQNAVKVAVASKTATFSQKSCTCSCSSYPKNLNMSFCYSGSHLHVLQSSPQPLRRNLGDNASSLPSSFLLNFDLMTLLMILVVMLPSL